MYEIHSMLDKICGLFRKWLCGLRSFRHEIFQLGLQIRLGFEDGLLWLLCLGGGLFEGWSVVWLNNLFELILHLCVYLGYHRFIS